MQNWNQWQLPAAPVTTAMPQPPIGFPASGADPMATMQAYMQYYSQPAPSGYTTEQWTAAQQQNWIQWQTWQQQYQQWQAQYGEKYQETMKQMSSQGQPGLTQMPLVPMSQPPPLPKEDTSAKPPLPPDNSGYGFPNMTPNQSKHPKSSSNLYGKPPLPPDQPPLPVDQSQITSSDPNPSGKRGASSNVDPGSAKKIKIDEELTEAEKTFDAQFKQWESQFNKWKQQNANHPDKTQYKQYEAKWTSWREKLIERREQMRKKREQQKQAAAKADADKNKSLEGGAKILNILSSTENQGLINNLLGIGKTLGLTGKQDDPQDPPSGHPPQTSTVQAPPVQLPMTMAPPTMTANMNSEAWAAQQWAAQYNSGPNMTGFPTGNPMQSTNLNQMPLQPYSNNQPTTNVNQMPDNFNQPPGMFNQTPGNFNQPPGNFNQPPGNFNQTPGNFNQTPGNFNQQPGKFNQPPGNFNQRQEGSIPPLFNFNQLPPSMSVRPSNMFDAPSNSSTGVPNLSQPPPALGPSDTSRQQSGYGQDQRNFQDFNPLSSRSDVDQRLGPPPLNRDSAGPGKDRMGFEGNRFGESVPTGHSNMNRGEPFGSNNNYGRDGPNNDFGSNNQRASGNDNYARDGCGMSSSSNRRIGNEFNPTDRLGFGNDRGLSGFDGNQGGRFDRDGNGQEFRDNRFGPMNSNSDRFNNSSDRFGPNSDRFGSGNDRSGSNDDRFGSGNDRFGLGNDRFGSVANNDRFGSGNDNFGSGPRNDRLSTGNEQMRPNVDKFGSSNNRFGGTNDRQGVSLNDDRSNQSNDRFNRPLSNRDGNRDSFGSNQNSFGRNNQSDTPDIDPELRKLMEKRRAAMDVFKPSQFGSFLGSGPNLSTSLSESFRQLTGNSPFSSSRSVSNTRNQDCLPPRGLQPPGPGVAGNFDPPRGFRPGDNSDFNSRGPGDFRSRGPGDFDSRGHQNFPPRGNEFGLRETDTGGGPPLSEDIASRTSNEFESKSRSRHDNYGPASETAEEALLPQAPAEKPESADEQFKMQPPGPNDSNAGSNRPNVSPLQEPSWMGQGLGDEDITEEPRTEAAESPLSNADKTPDESQVRADAESASLNAETSHDNAQGKTVRPRSSENKSDGLPFMGENDPVPEDLNMEPPPELPNLGPVRKGPVSPFEQGKRNMSSPFGQSSRNFSPRPPSDSPFGSRGTQMGPGGPMPAFGPRGPDNMGLPGPFGPAEPNSATFGPRGPQNDNFNARGPSFGGSGPWGPGDPGPRGPCDFEPRGFSNFGPGGPSGSPFGPRGPHDGPFGPRGPNHGPFGPGGPNDGPFGPRGPNNGPFGPCGPNQGPFGPRGPNDGPFGPGGPNNGPFGPGGPNNGPYGPGGPNNGPYGPGGPNNGPFGPGGPNNGPYGPRGPNDGPYGPRGPNDGPYGPRNPNDGSFGARGPLGGPFDGPPGPRGPNNAPTDAPFGSNSFPPRGNVHGTQPSIPSLLSMKLPKPSFGTLEDTASQKNADVDDQNGKPIADDVLPGDADKPQSEQRFGSNIPGQQGPGGQDSGQLGPSNEFGDHDERSGPGGLVGGPFAGPDGLVGGPFAGPGDATMTDRSKEAFGDPATDKPSSQTEEVAVNRERQNVRSENDQQYGLNSNSMTRRSDNNDGPSMGPSKEFCIGKQFNYNHGGRVPDEIVRDHTPAKVIDYGHAPRAVVRDYTTPAQSFDYEHGSSKPDVPDHEIPSKRDFRHWEENENNLSEYTNRIKNWESGSNPLNDGVFVRASNSPAQNRLSVWNQEERRSRERDWRSRGERTRRDNDANRDREKDRNSRERGRVERDREWQRISNKRREERSDRRRSSSKERTRERSEKIKKETKTENNKENERSKGNVSGQDSSAKKSNESTSQDNSEEDVKDVVPNETEPNEPENRKTVEPVEEMEQSEIADPPKTMELLKTPNFAMVDDLLCSPGRQNRPPKIVVILRGPPGSGKSFVAKLIKDKEVEQGGSAPRILSLDDYFLTEKEIETVDDNGKKVTTKEMVYEYEEAMELSYSTSLVKAFKKNITDGFFNFIILDSINEKITDYEEMWSFAKTKGFGVYVCEMDMDVHVCLKRNIHSRTEEEINRIVDYFEPTPSHHQKLDVTTMLQASTIEEVEMEDSNAIETKETPATDDSQDSQEDQDSACVSKWETMEAEDKLDRLDGLAKKKNESTPQTMEDFLQIPDYYDMEDTPGRKRVRWADLEERKEQEKMRAVGFVVGQTNWNRMMDPTKGGSALTQTKYI